MIAALRRYSNTAYAVLFLGYLVYQLSVTPPATRAVYPEWWINFLGGILLAAFLVAMGVHQFLAVRAASTPYNVAITIVAIVCLPLSFVLMAFDQRIHRTFAYLTLRPAMERYIDEGGACPTQRCLTDANGVQAFVYAQNDRAWTGLCKDSQGLMRAARDAARADRMAGSAPVARAFEAVVFRSETVADGWVACGASKRPLQEWAAKPAAS